MMSQSQLTGWNVFKSRKNNEFFNHENDKILFNSLKIYVLRRIIDENINIELTDKGALGDSVIK